MKRWAVRPEHWSFVVSALLLTVGIFGAVLGASDVAVIAWWIATAFGLALSSVWLTQEIRAGRIGVDVVAWLALLGTLLVDEAFAGAIITMMLTTGRLLEATAQSRAERELTSLVSRAPRTARRVLERTIETVSVEDVRQGDRLLVASGEVVPVDGRLVSGGSFDESSLTGEAEPAARPTGDDIRSGVVNAGSPIEMIATTLAADSTYSQIVRLVEQAQASSAPFVRTADRFAALFVPITLVLAGGAWWWSGDPVRAVAVLVVATPCPLLLAAPIAIMSGLSQAARCGSVVKGGAVLEQLATGEILLFDKTGTLTLGHPVVSDIVSDQFDADRCLRLAASLDQVSPHVLAGAIVSHARTRGLELSMPIDVDEQHGYGIQGTVDGYHVRVGRLDWICPNGVPAWLRRAARRASLEGALTVFAGVDGKPACAFLLSDPLRPDAHRMLRSLRAAGLRRVVLVTGDRAEAAESVGRMVGVDAVHSETDPNEKVEVVVAESRNGVTVMVGDGINDAPALATASVGVAMAAHGSTASSETADIVLTVDRIDRLADVMAIARRSSRIARQSVVVGMGLSAIAMVVAAAGYLPPALGALSQEAIDVLAIAVALTALRPPPQVTPKVSEADAEVVRRHLAEHLTVAQTVERVRGVADRLGDSDGDLPALRELLTELEDELVPHELAEEGELFPLMSKTMGGKDLLAGLSRTHTEIDHQVRKLRRMVDAVGDGPLDADDLVDLRRLLYGLYGVMRLHNAQEEEELYSLVASVKG
ncbi:MAG: heavy metal translocating P-type ATPase [Actinomycetes bacterium]